MRLIDADALMKELERETELADDWKTAHEISNIVKYAPTVNGWISIKDRKPDGTKGQVLALVMRDDGGWFRMIAWYSKKYGWFSDDPDFDNSMTVTHWMPIPDYPEVEE